MILVKYKQVISCPMKIYGSSTGWDPNHIKTKLKEINHHISVGKTTRRDKDCLDSTNERTLKIIIAITNPINPPSLLGIDRNTAYKCRKYHSG
jgi:hypothetical protein